MPNSLSPERKGYELRTRFIVAILAHAICDKGSSMHSFANKWLQSDTLATILCCNYRFSSDLLFTGNDIVTAFVQKKEKLHTEFGLDGVHQPFALNHCNLYKYEYQVQGRSHYFFYIHQEETTELSLTRQSHSQTKLTTTMGVIQSPPATRRSTRATTSSIRIVQAKSRTTMDVIIPPPATRRSTRVTSTQAKSTTTTNVNTSPPATRRSSRVTSTSIQAKSMDVIVSPSVTRCSTRVSSTQAESTTTIGVIISPPEARRRNRAASRGRDGPISKKAKPILKVNHTPKYHCEVAGEGIEYSWGNSKAKYRKIRAKDKTTAQQFRVQVNCCLGRAFLDAERIRKNSRRAREYMVAYFILSVDENAGNEPISDISFEELKPCAMSPQKIETMKQKVRTHRAALDFDLSFCKAGVCLIDD